MYIGFNDIIHSTPSSGVADGKVNVLSIDIHIAHLTFRKKHQSEIYIPSGECHTNGCALPVWDPNRASIYAEFERAHSVPRISYGRMLFNRSQCLWQNYVGKVSGNKTPNEPGEGSYWCEEYILSCLHWVQQRMSIYTCSCSTMDSWM